MKCVVVSFRELADLLMSGRTIPTTGEPPTPRSFDSLLTTHSSVFCLGASPLVQLVKNLPAMWEIWVRSLDWEDTLERGKATHSSILAWRIPWTGIGHDSATF